MTRIGIHYARRRFVFSQSEIPQMRACIHSSSCNEKHATLTALAVKRTFFLDRNSSSYKELGKREILRKAILRVNFYDHKSLAVIYVINWYWFHDWVWMCRFWISISLTKVDCAGLRWHLWAKTWWSHQAVEGSFRGRHGCVANWPFDSWNLLFVFTRRSFEFL